MELRLSILERNDATALVFTDTSIGWGLDGFPNFTEINGVTHTLHLYLTRKTLDATTSFDVINLTGSWTEQSDMVYTITASDLLVNGVPEDGVTSDTKIQDAIYTCLYVLDEDLATEAEYSVDFLAYIQIKTKVYDKLRQVLAIYNAYDSRSKEISDSLLQYTFLKAIEASAYVALEDELLETLDTIEKINTNGSNYTWQ